MHRKEATYLPVKQYDTSTMTFGKDHHHLPHARVSTLTEKLIFHTLPPLRPS